ncbi:hypothetical protein brsh051_10980 [Brooklawnia propionicigenes]|uniref:Uncharacterized protein n=1 Tax=Brooklawnia propionicigenes TaxID=3041175 RepID=A0AAN0K6H5_9ACTN|nr:hypothetical protein [Brooklawnia sp. SH051]MEA5120908.1 hypothetical protein [Propionibacterium sp.]BEH01817.1 hypothetical protein brsh051_10980 [Brooklawnia sp. SH051]
MSNETKDLSTADLAALIEKLSKQVEELDAEVTRLKASRPIPEADLLAIAAAAAAYMGYKGTVKAVSYASHTAWSAASRRSRTTNNSRGTMPVASL